MKSLKTRLKQLWELKHSERPAVRIGWWVGMAALCWLMLQASWSVDLFSFLLIVGNIGYGLTCFAWMLFHPRGWARATEEALRWSTWLAILATLLIYLSIEPDLSRTVSSGTILIIALACAPFCFMVLLFFSMFGVSIGAFTHRKIGDPEVAGTAAVLAWWIGVGWCLLGVFLFDWLKPLHRLQWLQFFCLPLFTLWITQVLRHFHYGEPRRAKKWVDALLKRLVFRRLIVRDGRYKTLDLRGMAIGLFVAVCMLLLGNRMLMTTQESALVSLFRIRAQLVNSLNFNATPKSDVVLAEMDASERANALTSSSEAAVQAAMIRRLSKLNPNCIVLPLPTLDIRAATHGETTEKAIAQTKRDLPDLAKAMREAGNVLLVVSPADRQQPEAKPLLDAAYAVGRFGEQNSTPAQVPSISLDPDGNPPIPLLVLAKKHGAPFTLQPVRGDRGAVKVSGVTIPVGLPGLALIDFRSGAAVNDTREGVASFPYSVLMASDQLMLNGEFAGQLQKAADYLHDKAIFLEPLVQPDLETPVGVLPQYEVLARATNSLLTHSVIRRVSPVLSALWTLLVGMGIGWVCAGREPLKASWRVALLLLVQIAYVLGVYLFGALWADPVSPLVTALITFLLVTQLTFALERDERERNRALFSRFLAKEFVDELLQAPTVHLGLGGEKRNVCVLFADVRNFTGFAENHPPEEVIEVMNLYLTAMTDALDLYGGLLDKYTGDGLMAFFEIKHDPQTELERAVCASLAMRDAALTVSEQLQKEGRQTLEIGIGMHYGEAIVGLVGNEQRQINYTALGHTVVVSARLQTLAAGGEVVISETVHAAVQEKFCFHAIEPVHVKGISTEMRPFHVLCPIEQSAQIL